MSESTAAPGGAVAEVEVEVWREAITMALYVAICLLAALTAVAERADAGHVVTLGIVWGTTVGLALAHWFAFRVSVRLVGGGRISSADARLAGAQLAGAGGVAAIVSIPVLLLPPTAELDVARIMLAGLLGLAGFLVARRAGAATVRSIVFGGVLVAVGLAIAVVKNILSHH